MRKTAAFLARRSKKVQRSGSSSRILVGGVSIVSGPMQRKVFHVTDKGRRKDMERGLKKTLLPRGKDTRKISVGQ
jgi:hypothetical protein